MLKSLQIDNFRNISSMMLTFSQKFNVFFGDNAAGKTSILEAVYLLATAKSFRTNHSEVLINHEQTDFTLFSMLDDEFSPIPVGLQRNRAGILQIRLRGEAVRSISAVSELLPVLFIGSDSHRILMDGPKVRRQFLDWGLFHVKVRFLTCWREYQRLLTHRNMALKARVSREEMLVWNVELASVGENLHAFRKSYVEAFLPYFQKLLEIFFDDSAISARYFPGWGAEVSLLEALNNQVSREMQIGHTLSGPHRADLLITVNGLPAEEVLSQGQQKLVSYALKLAQGVHLRETADKKPIFLIDDLPSELDIENQYRVSKILQRLESQVFVTGIDQEALEKLLDPAIESKMFHVKHGELQREPLEFSALKPMLAI